MFTEMKSQPTQVYMPSLKSLKMANEITNSYALQHLLYRKRGELLEVAGVGIGKLIDR